MAVLALMLASAYDLGLKLYPTNSLVVLGIGILAFYFNLIGAGDVKLLAALVLVIEPKSILFYFLLVSIFGAIISLGMLIYAKSKQAPWLLDSGVPYGVAIIFGFVAIFF